MPDADDVFAIGELSRRTGVPQATLRTWETRYGLPRPRRLPGGHRRYDASAVREVERVLAHRATGLEHGGRRRAGGRGAGLGRPPRSSRRCGERHPELVAAAA